MSTRLFLVRHGESTWVAERRIQGQADPPLSERGWRQVGALVEALAPRPVATVCSSSLRRAFETASCIAGAHGVPLEIDDAFQEVHLGAWQGRAAAELLAEDDRHYVAWCNDPAAVRPPGGETLDEARERVAPALVEITRGDRGATVVVVTHSIIGRVAICHLLGISLDTVARLKLKPGSLTMLRLDVRGSVLERLGDVSHLHGLAIPTWKPDEAGRVGEAGRDVGTPRRAFSVVCEVTRKD